MTAPKTTRSKGLKLFVTVVSTMMLLTLVVPTPTAEASSGYTPCPHYSIQDVFDNPHTDWDRDGLSNSTELYNGLNPCIVDAAAFCGSSGNALCRYSNHGHHHPNNNHYYYSYSYTYVSPCENDVLTNPYGDYDGDGFTNIVESRNNANACSKPCPNPTHADLALNPNGDWDGDRVSNAVEVSQGSNPCNSHSYYQLHNPCPNWTQSQRSFQAYLDWDHDGIYNVNDHSPCTYNARVQTHTQTTSQQLPHVSNTTTYAPTTHYTCPAGYPYFHSGNNRCYANPLGWSHS